MKTRATSAVLKRATRLDVPRAGRGFVGIVVASKSQGVITHVTNLQHKILGEGMIHVHVPLMHVGLVHIDVNASYRRFAARSKIPHHRRQVVHRERLV